MADQPKGCARVTGAVLGEPSPEVPDAPSHHEPAKEDFMTARVGQKAPDSDYFGKWILLCFYPGDFTFV